ncbi:MAG TPA: 3-oxoacyl-[acyl-carrier-protein] synthase III C-terminal domain-containing protein [Thermoanaerobaculia bacterium]|jgi:3-oxoacyl-[acyl-carrier-protein] synthase-3|nr:3-oxoacyl-[acyl-carrier-protein] synthase III C-terminal domain-containing protein [Thermoanaerobaculia bacterium]
MRTVIAATGSYIPPVRVPNEAFLSHDFRTADGARLGKTNPEIVAQFEAITGIKERRYAPDELVTSDIAYEAAADAVASSGADRESLDAILVAHNFGDVRAGSRRSDLVPALAARVKARLQIRNPATVAYDLIFGCPGWIQGVITADSMIRAGDARRVMVIGADTLSRISDPHDRDSMIYADGAAAAIVEAREEEGAGILARAARSDTLDHSGMLFMGPSYNEEVFLESLFLKMEGRKLYKYALQTVAGAMKQCLDAAGIALREVKKILLHQANGKMDEAICAALYALEGAEPPEGVLPMTISWLGNSSVATVPTLLDLIVKGKLEGHELRTGDIALFASVGAGMHINAFVYRMP